MSEIQTVILAFHGLFAGAFVLGFFLPLAMAGSEERDARSKEIKESDDAIRYLGPSLDLWLLLQDTIPIFWLIELISNAPDNVRAAKVKWKEESSVRLSFWIAILLVAVLPLHLLPFR